MHFLLWKSRSILWMRIRKEGVCFFSFSFFLKNVLIVVVILFLIFFWSLYYWNAIWHTCFALVVSVICYRQPQGNWKLKIGLDGDWFWNSCIDFLTDKIVCKRRCGFQNSYLIFKILSKSSINCIHWYWYITKILC